MEDEVKHLVRQLKDIGRPAYHLERNEIYAISQKLGLKQSRDQAWGGICHWQSTANAEQRRQWWLELQNAQSDDQRQERIYLGVIMALKREL
jgi:hypothetical protein